jgi:hypothetical protein
VVLSWLLGSALGPAAFAVPVNWAADSLADAAQQWFRRLRHTDELSRLVAAATGTSVKLTRTEFKAVRLLLEDQQTWNVAGRGTVEDLANRIAACLSPCDGRTPEDSHLAALSIARGLIEFAIADLDPMLFQKILLARLDRIQAAQASALDEALLRLHADLVAYLDAQGKLEDQRFAELMRQFTQMLDRLPPGPAYRGEIVAYLQTLISWLNTDPWPQDRRLDGPVLTPATIERKLRLVPEGGTGQQALDADEAARQCHRLVILGGAGSGKTWLAKRTARRSAENAIEALAAGEALDEVELPLYTTCSRLFAASGDIRAAAASSALEHLGDLGGSRLSTSLRLFFTERNTPTVLVIDSLDEAYGSDERLRQADTLPWRIVLTSRPSSWNKQLIIQSENTSSLIGELQPLRYPEDVEPFIESWFNGQTERAKDLIAQISRRHDLRQAAAVPLIVAFYCILGAKEPLPESLRDLYTKVVKRMLTGRWRGIDGRQLNIDACLRILRTWAWAGASNHPITGIGIWPEDIATEQAQLDEAQKVAVDHVATPIGPADIDTGMSLRRFCHRSIREHLVAEHVADLPPEQAAKILLPHLWYDPDWEYASAAALAIHPRRNQILEDLIRQVCYSDQLPSHLSAVDGAGEFRRFLARVAAVTSESDWSPEIAKIIGGAQAQAARMGTLNLLSVTTAWDAFNQPAKREALQLLIGETNAEKALNQARILCRLGPTLDEKAQASKALLSLVAREDNALQAAYLADTAADLDPTAEEKRRAFDILLRLLVSKRETFGASSLINAMVKFAGTAKDRRRASEALLSLLTHETDASKVCNLAQGIMRFAPTGEERHQACGLLFKLLGDDNINSSASKKLIEALVALATTAEERRLTLNGLITLLSDQPDRMPAERLSGVVALATSEEDRRFTRRTLLSLLVPCRPFTASEIATALAQLRPTAKESRHANDVLLAYLAVVKDSLIATQGADSQNSLIAERLAVAMAQLDPTAEHMMNAREALLPLLSAQTDGWTVFKLSSALTQFNPTVEERHQARQVLLKLLGSKLHEPFKRRKLIEGLVDLATTAEEKHLTRETLLKLLSGKSDPTEGGELIKGLIELVTTAEEKRLTRTTLIGLFSGHPDRGFARNLTSAVIKLAGTAEDKRQALTMTLDFLKMSTSRGRYVIDDVYYVDQAEALAISTDDKRYVRQVVLGLLAKRPSDTVAGILIDVVARLEPTAHDFSRQTMQDLARSDVSTFQIRKLLAAVRQNSTLATWLEMLPLLADLSD